MSTKTNKTTVKKPVNKTVTEPIRLNAAQKKELEEIRNLKVELEILTEESKKTKDVNIDAFLVSLAECKAAKILSEKFGFSIEFAVDLLHQNHGDYLDGFPEKEEEYL